MHQAWLTKHKILQVCIDVIVQRLGDATAAGLYKLLFSTLNGKTTTVSLYALPVCLRYRSFILLFTINSFGYHYVAICLL